MNVFIIQVSTVQQYYPEWQLFGWGLGRGCATCTEVFKPQPCLRQK